MKPEPYTQELSEAFRDFVLKNFKPRYVPMSTEIGYFVANDFRVTRSDSIFYHMLKIFEDEYVNKRFQIPNLIPKEE